MCLFACKLKWEVFYSAASPIPSRAIVGLTKIVVTVNKEKISTEIVGSRGHSLNAKGNKKGLICDLGRTL
jgi:hypothetical protein